MAIKDIFSGNNLLASINLNQIILNSLIAIAIIALGIFLGKIISTGLKKLSQKLELNKKIRGSFINLFIVVIRWSIYIIFINLGLDQLRIPTLTSFFTNILITIPAFIGALILLSIGFAIAIYLREIIEDAEVTGGDLISKIIFYFVILIFGVYALQTALISFDETTTRLILVILVAVTSSAFAYVLSKKTLRNNDQ